MGSSGGGNANLDAGAASALPCEVSAILGQHCASCHGSPTNFGAPMSLVSWDDLQRKSSRTPDRAYFQLMLERVKNDASPMPPAPNARLSSAEIASLEQWVAQGTPKATQTCTSAPTDAGPYDAGPATTKPADCQTTFELRAHGGTGEDDHTPFKMSSDPALEGNQYQCFYFTPPYTAGSGMLWYESILDNTPHLHHWILYGSENASHPSGTSAPCNASVPGAYFIVGWAPGATNTAIPNDVQLQLPSGPNTQLILEVHYFNDSGQPQQDSTGVRFCSAAPGTRPHEAAVHTLGTEGICLQPNTPSTEVQGTCEPNPPQGESHITGIWPHMHKHARHMKVVINRANGGSDVIHDAPFDFNAQVFHPKSDVVVRTGDTIETHCTYENNSSEQVHYGERTQDEMCYAFVTAWPAGSLAPAFASRGPTDLINRCGEELSIFGSCNGIADAPMTVAHPP
jgi:cytochrome c553